MFSHILQATKGDSVKEVGIKTFILSFDQYCGFCAQCEIVTSECLDMTSKTA